MRIALSQLDVTVGDLRGNLDRLLKKVEDARLQSCDVVVFPELALTGYPPEDLLLAEDFVSLQMAVLQELALCSKGITVLVGFVNQVDPIYSGDALKRNLANAVAVLEEGKIKHVVHKTLLPNYGVFDEERYFSPRQDPLLVFDLKGVKTGIVICEDLWDNKVADGLAELGAKMLLVVNASPYHKQKPLERELLVAKTALRTKCAVLYNNLVGGQDEIVFDGASLAADSQGVIVARSPLWKEDLLVLDYLTAAPEDVLSKTTEGVTTKTCTAEKCLLVEVEKRDVSWPSLEEEVYGALVVGIRAYVEKNRFRSVILGLSGGIDSALVATLAVDALGKDNVFGVGMPSPYSSSGSVEDARKLSERLGISFDILPISKPFAAFEDTLAEKFQGLAFDVTEENLQARSRGVLLMALSNKFGHLVLSTGNKSEMSVGYSTLYGDLCGGLSPIKDVEKTLVYRLSHWRNENVFEEGPLAPIPLSTLEKPPSAELAPDQVDSDSLPPYSILDEILERYVENAESPNRIVKEMHAKKLGELSELALTVNKIVLLVDSSEYKRRQAPPGLKITKRSFGRDRRLPLTNRFRPIAL